MAVRIALQRCVRCVYTLVSPLPHWERLRTKRDASTSGQHWENWLTKLRKALGQLFPPKLLGRIATIPNDSTVMASKGRIEIKQGQTVRWQGLGSLVPLTALGRPGRPPAYEHLYARVMERTVFGRPKAWMFVGGFGAVPGVGGGLGPAWQDPPAPLPFSLFEGPCRFGYTRTGGARIKG